MKFFFDENLPLSLVDTTEELGFESSHIRKEGMTGKSDVKIAEKAREEHSILVSRDLEFGNPSSYGKSQHLGVIIIRTPDDWSIDMLKNRWAKFLKESETEKLPGKVTVLEPGRYRQRQLRDG